MIKGDKINDSSGHIAVIGQGYVGLPLALLFANQSYVVFGIDVDTNKIAALRNGNSYLSYVKDEEIKSVLATGNYIPTSYFKTIQKAQAIIICVPTPLNHSSSPDITTLEQAAMKIGKYLNKGQLVVLESYTYQGTTRDILRPILERESGLKAGIDFHIGYSPERMDASHKEYSN